ncbi:hypothetical protein F4810DRAFT_599833 [Camillea tinctor]|nr:hypothetical protein F4810DRAFT_599833 [Camillea tinctor]
MLSAPSADIPMSLFPISSFFFFLFLFISSSTSYGLAYRHLLIFNDLRLCFLSFSSRGFLTRHALIDLRIYSRFRLTLTTTNTKTKRRFWRFLRSWSLRFTSQTARSCI